MRTRSLIGLTTLVLSAAACQGGSRSPATLPEDLKRDLQAASSADGLQLANATGGYQRTRFVSEIERSNLSAPTSQIPRPRPMPKTHAGLTQATTTSPAPEAVQQAETQSDPQPEPVTQAPASDEPRVPVVAPRPAPVPVEVGVSGEGARGGRDNGPPDIGDVIGVIFRGGGRVGDDHCVPHRRPGRGFPFPQLPSQQLPPALRHLSAYIR